ncbi:hypothetical protein Tco_0584467, partial [Tanacetum coccineum]
ETVIKEWEDRTERAATTASSLKAEQDIVNAAQLKLNAAKLKLMLLGLIYCCPLVNTVRFNLMLPVQVNAVEATEDMGEDLAAPTDSHSTPIHTQPSSSKAQKKKSRRK